MFGLARSGLKVPQKYFDTYYKNVEDYIVSVDGVLSRKKNTEYSRVILALTAIGKNPPMLPDSTCCCRWETSTKRCGRASTA